MATADDSRVTGPLCRRTTLFGAMSGAVAATDTHAMGPDYGAVLAGVIK